MNLFTFSAHFGDENACRTHFKSERDNQGVICKKYGHTEHYWKQDKWSYECKSCRFRTSLKSGTIIQHSKLSFSLVSSDVLDQYNKEGVFGQGDATSFRVKAL